MDSPLPASESPRYFNRELSWLEFDRRVLALAEDPALPLLERIKFLAIFARNLDEFFQVRVAAIEDQRDAGIALLSPDGLGPEEQADAIRRHVTGVLRPVPRLVEEDLLPALRLAGIPIGRWRDLASEERSLFTKLFESRIFPVLTPLAVDPAHPFPYVSNLSLNLAVILADPRREQRRFARIKVPPNLPRFLTAPGASHRVPIEEIIAAHLPTLFPGVEIREHSCFRVTRNVDLEIEEEEIDDLLAAIESGLQRQRRASDAVRLEVSAGTPREISRLLLEEFELGPEQLYESATLLDLGALQELHAIDRPDLKEEPWIPRIPLPLRRDPETQEQPRIFDVLQRSDVLVHHPYESFDASIESFLEQAASDPDVLAIKHTIYRTTSPNSSIGRILQKAASTGKQVVALVELKARFDERANIDWARALEQKGVHVVYGLVGLKTHAKLALVVRKEGDGLRRYCHLGTGNYNPVTARAYEDIGLLTANPEIGADVSDLFNFLTGYAQQMPYRKLLVAPGGLRDELIRRIEEEARHPDGSILIKANGLSDPRSIDALYAASQAGARVDLLLRSICCLRPGVPGLSERIRVRSILGRFLEHSRILRFGSRDRGYRYYIGSADLMSRNLDRRVEAFVPIEDPALCTRLEEVLQLAFSPLCSAWELGSDGSWDFLKGDPQRHLQSELQRRAVERTAPTQSDPLPSPALPMGLTPPPGSQRCALLRLGNTAFNLVIADIDASGHLHRIARQRHVLKPGAMLVDRRRITDELVARCHALALQLQADVARVACDRVIAVCSASLQEASNGSLLIESLTSTLGTPLQVLDNESKTQAILVGLRQALPQLPQSLLIFDLSGGNLLVAAVHGDTIEWQSSLPLGITTLHARHVNSDPPSPAEALAIRGAVAKRVSAVARRVRAALPRPVVVCGETAKTLLAIAEEAGLRHGETLDGGLQLGREAIEELDRRILALSRAERLALRGAEAHRLELLPVGTLVLSSLLQSLAIEEIVLSAAGLTEGLLLASGSTRDVSTKPH